MSIAPELDDIIEEQDKLMERLSERIAGLEEALREIAESTHLGNSWARHKAKEALEETK